jgi:hypothetical protein
MDIYWLGMERFAVWNFIQVEMSFVGKPCVVKHIFNILSKPKNSACAITFTKCMMHASE